MRKWRMGVLALIVLIGVAGSEGSSQAATSVLTGDYFGSVAVDTPAGLGNIDLAFHLEFLSGNVIDPERSYIILDKTILFPKAAQVDGKDVGPKVEAGSTFNGQMLNLTTLAFTSYANGRNATRKLVLTGTSPNVSGNSISGTYVETITGFLARPITITGSFVLVRPVSITPGAFACRSMDVLAPFGELTIDEIRAGGANPDWVEFEDISCALYLYHDPGNGVYVSESTIGQATAEYKTFLKQ